MDSLFFKAYDKYGIALSMLYPSQIQSLQEALAEFAETGEIQQIEDSFTRLAFMMILCDLRHARRQAGADTKGAEGETQKQEAEDFKRRSHVAAHELPANDPANCSLEKGNRLQGNQGERKNAV